MTNEEITNLARLFADLVRTFDLDRLRDLYAESIGIWHNYDEVTQSRDQGLKSLAWLQRNTSGYHWDDLRIDVVSDGYVQRHVTRATGPPLAVPTMMRVWCAEQQITRIEHYLDSARFGALLR